MVYKLVSQVRGRAADMWIDSGTVNEGELRVLNTNNEFKAHYKNIIVDNFESVAPTEVTYRRLNQLPMCNGYSV
jgi:hypothetical protein